MKNLILNVYKFILMKRLLFAGLLGVITSLGLRAGEPTTMWPYLFDDFMEASIYSKSGNKGEAKVNIHLLRNDLHYLNGSQIYCPDNQNDIGRVVFADSTEFVRCENFFIEVLGETPQAILGRRTTGDFDRLLQGTGAYGTSSSTSAVDNLSSLQLGGIANLNYDMIRVERENGQTLPVSTRLCFIVGGEIVNANKKSVSKLLPESSRKEFNVFLKANKIKWSKVDHLQKVLGYISPLLGK